MQTVVELQKIVYQWRLYSLFEMTNANITLITALWPLQLRTASARLYNACTVLLSVFDDLQLCLWT